MKNLLFSITILSFLSGCKAWNTSMIKPSMDPISPKLLTLERKIEDVSSPNMATIHAENQIRLNDEILLFTKEAEQNLMDPYGDKYGTMVLKRYVVDVKYGMGNLLLSAFLFSLPNLFGVPILNIRYKISAEIRIMDRNNRLIGNYNAIGESRVKVAYYYGYSIRNMHADRKAYTDALNDAIDKIRPQLESEVIRINQILKETGRLYPDP